MVVGANSDLLTINEVADQCRCSTTTVRRWINNGLLPKVTLPGGSYRVKRAELEAILEGNDNA